MENQLNPDPNKQAQEIIFSRKKIDSNLSYEHHIRSILTLPWRGPLSYRDQPASAMKGLNKVNKTIGPLSFRPITLRLVSLNTPETSLDNNL